MAFELFMQIFDLKTLTLVLTCYERKGIKAISQGTDLHECPLFQESFPCCRPHCLEWKRHSIFLWKPLAREVWYYLQKRNLNLLAEPANGKLWFLQLHSYDLCGMPSYLSKHTNSLPPCWPFLRWAVTYYSFPNSLQKLHASKQEQSVRQVILPQSNFL